MGYFLIYFFHSFTYPLPWSNNPDSDFPESTFFHDIIVKQTSSISIFGDFNLYTYLGYIGSFFIIYMCIAKGVKISGKVAIYTGSLPFILLLILILRGMLLPGAFDGLYYLFKPEFGQLSSAKIWAAAVS
jgi:SNF family Na+-dependent transporter